MKRILENILKGIASCFFWPIAASGIFDESNTERRKKQREREANAFL